MKFIILYQQGVMTLGEMIDNLKKLDPDLAVRIVLNEPENFENKRLLVNLSFEENI